MAKGFNGELLHSGFVRTRAVGSGSLRMTLSSLDDVTSKTLPVIALSPTPGREPMVLAGFIAQKMALKIEVNALDEWFSISKITVFVRQYATEFPQ